MNPGTTQPSVPLDHDRVVDEPLPDRQTTNHGTLAWIKANRPDFPAAPAALRCRPVLLLPEPAWYADPDLVDSIHGVSHNARVALLASVLATQHSLEREFADALCVAAAVHDCRRLNDRADSGHGLRAAKWLGRHQAIVTASLGLAADAKALKQATVAIALHDIPYVEFTAAQERDYRTCPQLVDLLKAADCLDRYRLAQPRWWPDTSRLRVRVPEGLHPIAFDLVVHTEQARLDGATHREAFVHARRLLPFD